MYLLERSLIADDDGPGMFINRSRLQINRHYGERENEELRYAAAKLLETVSVKPSASRTIRWPTVVDGWTVCSSSRFSRFPALYCGVIRGSIDSSFFWSDGTRLVLSDSVCGQRSKERISGNLLSLCPNSKLKLEL